MKKTPQSRSGIGGTASAARGPKKGGASAGPGNHARFKELHARCLWAMLRPLARYCLRHSLKLQDFGEVLKAVFLEVAREEGAQSDIELSDSRLSVMTGVHRRDIVRLEREIPPKRGPEAVTRVIGFWQTHKKFIDKTGHPRVLSYEGKESEFVQLVAAVSLDLNPYAILFELERIGAVEKSAKGLKLQIGLFRPDGDVEAGFELLASDVEDMIGAVEENITQEVTPPNLHIKTQYDNIPQEALPAIRKAMIEEGSQLHRKLREILAKHDRDLNPALYYKPGRFRVALGTFSRIEPYHPKVK